MKTAIDCIPCVFKQALSASKKITDDRQDLLKVQYSIMQMLPSQSLDISPAELSFYALKKVNEILNSADPFKAEKLKSNEFMLGLYPQLKKVVEYSTDELYTSLKIAAAGNIIDMGILQSFDVRETIKKALANPFKVDHFEELKKDLRHAEHILYIADNAGEIVADKLFLETLGRKDAIVVVKGAPMLNDATMEDAEFICLDDVAQVISNGSGMIGTVLADCSNEFRNVFNRADVIISKGQANFECLDETDRNMYFLLTVKCAIVGDRLRVKEGDAVLVNREKSKR